MPQYSPSRSPFAAFRFCRILVDTLNPSARVFISARVDRRRHVCHGRPGRIRIQ